jgi:predicted ATPase
VRLLVSAEGTPFELFERVLSPEEANKAGGTTHGHIRRDSSSGSHGSMQLQHSYSSSSSSSGGPEVVVDMQLAFVKDRTISRLTEMQSIEYLIQYAKQHAPQLVLALQEMQQQQVRQL